MRAALCCRSEATSTGTTTSPSTWTTLQGASLATAARHCLLVPQVAAVADDERGLGGKAERHLVGSAPADDEADAARRQCLLDLAQPLQHERVVAPVGLRVVGGQAKTDHDRQAQPVGLVDRMLERGVRGRPL